MTGGSWKPGKVVVWWEAWRGRMYGADPSWAVRDELSMDSRPPE